MIRSIQRTTRSGTGTILRSVVRQCSTVAAETADNPSRAPQPEVASEAQARPPKETRLSRRTKHQYDKKREWPLSEALSHVRQARWAKFDETLEAVFRLNIDPRQAEQNLRGAMDLPHGTGRQIKVAVFARGDKVQEALDAGAERAGGEELVEEVKKGMTSFDRSIATPDIMPLMTKIGKILGPRGLMPNSKVGTVTFDVGDAVRRLKLGNVQYRTDSFGNIHLPVGKLSFSDEKLIDNIRTAIQKLLEVKPAAVKRKYVLGCSVCSSMGPGVRLNVDDLYKLAGYTRRR